MDLWDVIIIGAGASGLMAARELARAGKRVLVLEVRERIGGRICPLSESAFDYPAQGGGEFIHGHAPLIHALVQEAGLHLSNTGQWWSVRDGEPTVGFAPDPHESVLKQKLDALTEDMSVARFLDQYFAGEQYAALRDSVCRRTEGYDAGDPERASAWALRDEIDNPSGWKTARIKEGYGALVNFLQNECIARGTEFLLEKEVVAIDGRAHPATVRCRDGSQYRSSVVIISVPLPLIECIAFTPAISEKVQAVSQMGFGGVIKILLRFKDRWWKGARDKNFDKLFFMFSREAIPSWWTQYPDFTPTLTGWLAGPKSLPLSKQTNDDIVDIGLVSLSHIFDVSQSELRAQLVATHVANWPTDPFANGAYSYATPGTLAARKEILKPVAGKIFFCGEALYAEECGTVEAALGSGAEAASVILNYHE